MTRCWKNGACSSMPAGPCASCAAWAASPCTGVSRPATCTILMSPRSSVRDADGFHRRHKRSPVRVVANGVDTEFFAPPRQPASAPDAPADVVFLGHLSHPPNLDAAWYLLREIAPRLRALAPAARCVILGAQPPPEMLALRSQTVEVTGWVEDIRPWLWRCRVAVLPMRVGTGIKNKLLEAWACGCPVVATTRACQGIPARHGDNLLVADTPQEIAAAAARIINDEDLRLALGRRGRQTVLDNFTWSAAAQLLKTIATDCM